MRATSKSSSVTVRWARICSRASSVMVSTPSSFSLSARASHSLRQVEWRERWLKSCDMAGLQYRVVSDVWYESNGEAILEVGRSNGSTGMERVSVGVSAWDLYASRRCLVDNDEAKNLTPAVGYPKRKWGGHLEF